MYIYTYCIDGPAGITVSVFANGQGDKGLIIGLVIPKTQKMVLDAFLVDTHHYKIWIRGNWRNSRKVTV